MARDTYDAFISYRREPDGDRARLILEALENAGFKVFRDLEGLRPGLFDNELLERIARTPNFIVLLSPHSLDRREGANDYFCREIAQAIKQGRNIIPVLMPGFEFPPESELAEEIKLLPAYNGIRYSPVYLDATFQKIIDNLRVGFFRSVLITLGGGLRPGRRHKREGVATRRARAVALAVLALLLAGAGVAAYKFLRPAPSVEVVGGSDRFLNREQPHARESAPAFSPDGKDVVYVSNEGEGKFDLYRKRLDGVGEPFRLTNSDYVEHCPAWSKGGYIAYLREPQDPREEWGFYKIPDTGAALNDERKIAKAFPKRSIGGRIEGRSISWTPDGKHLAVMDKDSDQEPFRIYLIPADPSEGPPVPLTQRELSQPGAPNPAFPGDSNPAFSPDGSMLAFTRAASTGSSDIYVLRMRDGLPDGEPFAVTHHSNKWVVDLAWSPDGRSLIFSSNYRGGKFKIWALPATPYKEGVEPKLVFSGGTRENLFDPAVSVNGDMAFSNFLAWDIDIVPYDTETQRGGRPAPTPQIPADPNWQVSPHFARSGNKISYVSDENNAREIFVFDLRNSRATQVTNFGGPDVGSPRLSPDGERVVFDSEQNANRDIYVVSASGGERPRELVTDGSLDVRPSWSADGRWVYFGSNRPSRDCSGSNRADIFQVWKVPDGGGRAVQVTCGGGREAFASLDNKFGDFVYYAKEFERHWELWRVPPDGGREEPVLDNIWQGYWAPTFKGIYHLVPEGTTWLGVNFYSFETREDAPVPALRRVPQPVTTAPGLAASPDGRWVLLQQEVDRKSNIALVTLHIA